MQVQLDSSQVRSARTMCSASAGSVNSTYSRAKSPGSSPRLGMPRSIVLGLVTKRTLPAIGPISPYRRAMRLGVLDVGSNTVHLLVVDAHPGAHPDPVRSHKTELQLAELLRSDGSLGPEGILALVEAVAAARAAAEQEGVEDLVAFATSAVRDATDAADVLTRVREDAGVDL